MARLVDVVAWFRREAWAPASYSQDSDHPFCLGRPSSCAMPSGEGPWLTTMAQHRRTCEIAEGGKRTSLSHGVYFATAMVRGHNIRSPYNLNPRHLLGRHTSSKIRRGRYMIVTGGFSMIHQRGGGALASRPHQSVTSRTTNDARR